MNFLESIFEFYFFTFVTILPLVLIISTLMYFANNKDKISTKNLFIILLFLFVNTLTIAIISIYIIFYNEISVKTNSAFSYFLCYVWIIVTYVIITYIENIALTPKKYMKTMSSNLQLCQFKSHIIQDISQEFIKFYIFISYVIAILLFQLEKLDLYVFENEFLKTMMDICENSITIILAFELITNYKKQKLKEIDGLVEGSKLFNKFFGFSLDYINLFNEFINNFHQILYSQDKVFYNKYPTIIKDLENKLLSIREKDPYDSVKESVRIKTYDIVYDCLIDLSKRYLKQPNKTDNKKAIIIYIALYFEEIVKKDIRIKNKKHLLKKVYKYANNYTKKLNKDYI